VSDMAEALDAHVQSVRNHRCSCGWTPDASKSVFDPDNVYVQHRRHVAAMLKAAGFGLLADAWDEGFESACDSDVRANPYRATR